MSVLLDFRSDTRTAPDAAMRAAMAAAEVGDDAYGDDPCVLRLEEAGARLLGKEAALFLPSSTMTNLVAVLAAAPDPGTRLLTGAHTHVARFEDAGMRRFARVELVPLAQRDDGAPDPDALEAALREGARAGRPQVVSLENTCMLHTGNALELAVLDRLAGLARSYGAHVHLDGARLANAAVALGLPVEKLAVPADSVTFCLAKGLGAPVGSLLGAPASFVDRARSLRLQLGGTMHQSGVLAAAALAGLEGVSRLAEDHALAAALARGLGSVPGAEVAEPPCRTNIVTVRVRGVSGVELMGRLGERGVRVLPLDDGWVRFVVHREHRDTAVPVVVRAVSDAVRLRPGG
ncbi:low specificity L-threonine aldolase [Streptomyces sp. CBMA152]|uniref:threonine aldolase family protein n=1 Tax=Streptomyces sp. CBMA152 TaxID=1896312 RepID=UPI0016603587|nr:GntG family PLP-dependent aldolase [Streptomyces sp. CBMA152]